MKDPKIQSSILLLSFVSQNAYPTVVHKWVTFWIKKKSPGGHSNGKRGYQARPWTHKKHPYHVLFRYEKRPYIRVFACIFLNLPVMFFPKLVYMTKNTPFFQILHVFAPLNDVRAYSAWSWKTILITWIFGWAWYPLTFECPPGKIPKYGPWTYYVYLLCKWFPPPPGR